MAAEIRASLSEEISALKIRHPGFAPKLTVVQVGARDDSNTYIRMKLKAAAEVGIEAERISVGAETSEASLVNLVSRLNDSVDVHGILVQLPLPDHINEKRIIDVIALPKDVDGFHVRNSGELALRNGKPHFVPCTPKGVMRLLGDYAISGRSAVVLGRSNIVGVPVFHLLNHQNATVTMCHSRTPRETLIRLLRNADIVVAAVGIPRFVRGEWLKEGAVVIDVGINYIEDASRKSGRRLVGDVHYDEAVKVASAITPVPGGVGPMTVAMLLENTLQAAKSLCLNQREPKVTCMPLEVLRPVPSDGAISAAQQPKRIDLLAKELHLLAGEVELYGSSKAKVSLSVMERMQGRAPGSKYVVVTGITPTPMGEGKTTTLVGLCQALQAHCGRPTFACLRQPSQGPTFGIKGGAAGGGYAQIIPMSDLNLHLTGDIHAVTAANNLMAAAVDTRYFHESTQSDTALYGRLIKNDAFTPSQLERLARLGISKQDPAELTPEEQVRFARLNIDPEAVEVRRVMDTSDRFLREITIGQSPTEKGRTRTTGFDMAVASEVMAVMALAESLEDLRARLGRIIVARDTSGNPITTEDLGVAGAMSALMVDAIKPNLMQTLEGSPAFIHAGPFANIAHGNSSVVADKVALSLVGPQGFVVTEAGFGADMGMEKFFDIKCRASKLQPDAAVIVATVRALKTHGASLAEGCSNLQAHVRNACKYGVRVVVAINAFTTDTPEEINTVIAKAKEAGAHDAVCTTHWADGGAGAKALAEAVIEACNTPADFKLLYEDELPLEGKIERICKEIYGADGVEFADAAKDKLQWLSEKGFSNLPICMAKTALSLSHDPKLKGVPSGFKVPVRDIRLAAGAGFVYPICGSISTMPGLPTRPAYMNVDIDTQTGEVTGLF